MMGRVNRDQGQPEPPSICTARCLKNSDDGQACNRRGRRNIFTRPYTPKTNGKAERRL
jgi:hypothetical protein